MDFRPICLALLCAAGLALAPDALSQTLYKLTDRNGKVTYAEKVPPGYDGKVQRVDIDPNANRMDAPRAPPASPEGKGSGEGSGKSSAAEGFSRDRQKRERSEEKIAQARERLEDARKNLKEAVDNPTEDDIKWMGKVGGGARPVHSEEYQMRISKLEAAVKAAEEALKEAEKL